MLALAEFCQERAFWRMRLPSRNEKCGVMKHRSRYLVWAFTLLSAGAVAAGVGCLWRFENTPGASPVPAPAWPAASRLRLASDRFTLVLFAHPQCPCTRATIESLEQVVRRCGDRLAACVLFVRPQGSPLDWEKTALWESAAALPGVTVLTDEGGEESCLFHAKTSGHAFLYDPRGQLCFSGGITPGRGHNGPCPGQQAVIDMVTRGAGAPNHSPVFGCPLLATPE
jgi:hypothetical protein